LETLTVVWTALKVVIGISFVIFWHELGHFLAAKWNGVYVKTFSVGFPPRLIRLFKYKETEYVLGSIPLGGYVHMLGEDETQANESVAAIPERAEAQPKESTETATNADDAVKTSQSGSGASDRAEAEAVADGGEEPIALANHPGAFFNKSVWARMVIMSAGVVMNVILGFGCFLVVFLTGGRLQAPARIGAVQAGGPAYEAGLRPGDRILVVNGRPEPTFEVFVNAVLFSGPDEVVELTVEREGAPEPIQVQVEPHLDPTRDVPSIGVSSSSSLRLADELPYLPPNGAADRSAEAVDLQGGDRIVAVGPVEGEPIPVEDAQDLKRELASLSGEPVRLVVSRAPEPRGETSGSESRVSVVLPPVRFVDFGFRLKPGPIVATRPDSPAEAAGLEAGDVILSVDGDANYDPLRLPYLAWNAAREDRALKLEVQRGDAKSGSESETQADAVETIEIKPVEGSPWLMPLSDVSPLAVDPLGFAFEVPPMIAGVEPGSPADEAGLQAGKRIEAVHYEVPALGERPARQSDLRLGDEVSWVTVFDIIQQIPIDRVELTIEGREERVALRPRPVADWPFPSRGLTLMPETYPMEPLPFGESLRRAGTETVSAIGSIYTLIQRLFQGRVSSRGVAGPIRIAGMAYRLAGDNWATFLWFIGFISINLAVVNFLPLPPLDGGRMVFLIGEAVRGRPLPESWQAIPTYIGLMLLLGLMAFVLIQDTWLSFFER